MVVLNGTSGVSSVYQFYPEGKCSNQLALLSLATNLSISEGDNNSVWWNVARDKQMLKVQHSCQQLQKLQHEIISISDNLE